MMKRFDTTTGLFVFIALLLVFVPLVFKKFIVYVTAYLLINMLLAAGTWAIFHQAGQALFAIAVIAGISSYVSAILGGVIGNTWLTILAALVVSCGVGMLFYIIGSRVPGHIQFAVLNLTFIFVFNYFIIAFSTLTKGPDGLAVSYFTPKTFFSNMSHRYWAVLFFTSAGLIMIQKIMASRFGSILTLIGRNPLLAETIGIDVKRYTILTYIIFSPLIGFGGALYTHFVGYVSPAPWNADFSVIIIFCSLIGGAGNIFGPILGAIVATGIPIVFDITAEFRFGIVGILAILIFLLKPDGILGWIKQVTSKKIQITEAERSL